MSGENHAPAGAPAWLGTERHYLWLERLVRAVLVLNLVDALATLVWVRLGVAREANPLLAELVDGSPVAFVLAKVLLVSLGSLLLWRLRSRPAAVVGVFLAFLAYYTLLLVHLNGLARMQLASQRRQAPPAQRR